MRHLIVTRVSLGLCAVLTAAAFGFAWLAGLPSATPNVPAAPAHQPLGAAQPVSGAQLFDAHCAHCHRDQDLAEPLRTSPAPLADAAQIELFLATHGDCEALEDQEIVTYLLDLARRARP